MFNNAKIGPIQCCLSIALFTFCMSCHSADETVGSEAFDPERWKIKEGKTYLYRDGMLSEVMKGPRFRMMRKEKLTQSLGEPDRADSNFLFYTIDQQFLGPFPLHTKTLVIKMYPDSTVQWMKIHQ